MGGVRLGGARLFVALDARAVSAARIGRGVRGERVQAFARVPLAPGVLAVSPSGPSLSRADEAQEAIRRAAEAVGGGGGRAVLVLPDGLARLALVSLPKDAAARDFVRFRFDGSLPWPADQAAIDALPVGRDRVVGAAVRRSVVAEYERALAAAGLVPERVQLAPLLSLEALLRRVRRDAVHVVLSDEAASFAVVRGGELVAFLNRRRDVSAGESARLEGGARSAERLGGASAVSLPLTFSGSDAGRLRREAGAEDEPALAGPAEWPDSADACWLRGATG